MLRRVESENERRAAADVRERGTIVGETGGGERGAEVRERGTGVRERALAASASHEAIASAVLQVDAGSELELLPPGHPSWVRDGVSISQRARELVARLRPVVVRVLRFWDHHVRAIVVHGRRISVDAAGSYRME